MIQFVFIILNGILNGFVFEFGEHFGTRCSNVSNNISNCVEIRNVFLYDYIRCTNAAHSDEATSFELKNGNATPIGRHLNEGYGALRALISI